MSERTCPNCRDEKNTLCKGLGGLQPLVCRACGHCFRCPDSKPLPWLRAEEVKESGSYWWVNETSYATPVTVYVMKSGTDESCFASAGQLGWWKAMQLKELGGLWQRIPEPELPKGEKA